MHALLLTLLAAQPFVNPGERVCFFGDSITNQGKGQVVLEWAASTQAPSWNLDLTSIGLTGRTAATGLPYMPSLILADTSTSGIKANAVVLRFGMNDGYYAGWTQAHQDAYINATASIVSQLRAASVRAILASPTAVEPKRWTRTTTTASGYNGTLRRFKDAASTWAAAQNPPVLFVDLFTPTYAAYTAASSTIYTTDGIHPFMEGGGVEAQALAGALMGVTLTLPSSYPAGTTSTSHFQDVIKRQLEQNDRMNELLMIPIPELTTARTNALATARTTWRRALDAQLELWRRTIWGQ